MEYGDEECKSILVRQLKNAYRKYKTYIYYDNHSAIQREKLAYFEKNNFLDSNKESSSFFDESKIETSFYELADKIINNELNAFSNDMGIIAFPKKMDNTDDSEIISNHNESSNTINQIHYFIDLPVEAHILGVLWILRCGFILDDKLYKNCYGNRLNEHLLKMLKEGAHKKLDNNFSPFLFEPYYKKYVSWRDNALDNVKNLLDNDKNAIMISLDFKNYYYSSSIDFDTLRVDLADGKEKISSLNENNDLDEKINCNLTSFIEKVFNNYYNEFKTSNDKKEFPFIPLGFLPSLIIANWNLQAFDQAILEDLHPSYYGRYVDDILIVFDSHEKSESHGSQQYMGLRASDIIKKYFTKDDEYPMNKIFYFDNFKPKFVLNDDEELDYVYERIIKVHNLKNRELEGNYEYHYENLQIQPKKVKLYTFSHKNSTAIIDNFKKEIIKNSSEFKLMKVSDKLFDEFKGKLFEIDYVESINKLNDIRSVKINKFEISKLLSGILNSSVFSSENIEKKLIYHVIEAFDANIFDFFILWEKLFSLLYINENYDELEDFIKKILSHIDTLSFKPQNSFFEYHINEEPENDCELVKDSLKRFIKSTVTRVLSLKSSELFKVLPFYENNYIINSYFHDSFCFISSSMINNRLMKYPLQNTFKIQNLIKANWGINNNIEDIKYDLVKNNESAKEDYIFRGFCYPRYIKLHEIQLNNVYNNLFKDRNFELKDLIKLHSQLNFYGQYCGHGRQIISNISEVLHYNCDLNCHNTSDCPINDNFKSLTIGQKKNTKLKVGLINTKLDYNNFLKRLDGVPDLNLERFDKIKSLINDAINNEVELLLMPEMYIPFEWVTEVVNMSKIHQMAIIFGVEPIVHDGTVYNYIMSSLPFDYDDSYYETMLSCRLKNHYAPEELQYIHLKHLKEPKSDEYYLYSWNGIHIVPYCCYEIADIHNRSNFKSCCDIVTVSEFNKDAIYFSNIAESLTRDIYCYCIKSNTSEFGGTGIIQPASSQNKKIVELKGGENDYLVIQELDIDKIRKNAIHSDMFSHKKDNDLKPNPPGLNIDIIKERMGRESKYSKDKFNHDSIDPRIIENGVLSWVKDKVGDDLTNITFAIWGLSLKPGTDNVVSAPSVKIINELISRNANIKAYDPKSVKNFKEIVDLDENTSINSKYDVLDESDYLIILTAWDEFKQYDLNEMGKRMNKKIICDCRNVIVGDVGEFTVYKINAE